MITGKYAKICEPNANNKKEYKFKLKPISD